jgi:hypothetical protein
VKWSPFVPPDARVDDPVAVTRLGLLSAIMGDGVLRLYVVPHTTSASFAEFRPDEEMGVGEGDMAPVVVNAVPWAVARVEARTSRQDPDGDVEVVLITAMDWSPSDPSMIVTGHSDGAWWICCSRLCSALLCSLLCSSLLASARLCSRLLASASPASAALHCAVAFT